MEAATPIVAQEAVLSKPIIRAHPWVVLAVLLFGEYMIVLDTTIVNVAIPSLSNELHASLDQILWVVNAYVLTFAVLLITAGRLGDILGPKRLYITGMGIFTGASLACGLSQDPNYLIAFRVIQAVGGATLTPQPGPIITSTFPENRRAAAFGFFGAVIGLAAVSGPTLGGFLTSTFSWRTVFFPNVPVGIISMILAFLVMPELRAHTRSKIDVVGMLLATAGLSIGVWAVIEGAKYDWGPILNVGAFTVGPIQWSLVSIPTAFVLSAVLLIAFAIWEMRQDSPLLPLSLFDDRNFTLGNIVVMAVTFCMIGVFLFLLLFLQEVRHLTALEAGVAILPNAASVTVFSVLTTRFMKYVALKYLPVIGMVSYMAGIVLLIRGASLQAQGSTFTLPLILTGVGFGLTIPATATLAMQRVAPTSAGAASGFLNTCRQVGLVLGTGIVGAILQSRLTLELHSQATHYAKQLPGNLRASFIDSFTRKSGQSIGLSHGQLGGHFPPNTPHAAVVKIHTLGDKVFNHAFLNAMRPSLVAPIAMAMFAGIAALAMRSSRAAPVTVPVAAPEALPGARRAEQPVLSLVMPETIMMPTMSANRTIPISSVPKIRPPLLIADRTGKEWAIERGLTVGRMASNDVVVDDPKVSRRHAEILIQGGKVVLRDLDSTNGTQVNGHRVSEDYALRPGDEVLFGDTPFLFANDLAEKQICLTETGRNGEQSHLIETPLVVIGRSPACDIVLNNDRVSRRHSQISLEDGQMMIQDLVSLNGTRVNGALISSPYPLHDGDSIGIHNLMLTYHDNRTSSERTPRVVS